MEKSETKSPVDLSEVCSMYKQMLSRAGGPPTMETGHKLMGWSTEKDQLERFEAFALHMPQGMPYSLLDYGSGSGHLFDYLLWKGRLPRFYIACDINDDALKMVEQRWSKNLYGGEVICIKPEEFKNLEVDYSFASGTFNIKMRNSNEDWEAYVKETLLGLYASTRKMMVFNMLDSTFKPQDKDAEFLYLADMDNWQDWCCRNLPGAFGCWTHLRLRAWTFFISR